MTHALRSQPTTTTTTTAAAARTATAAASEEDDTVSMPLDIFAELRGQASELSDLLDDRIVSDEPPPTVPADTASVPSATVGSAGSGDGRKRKRVVLQDKTLSPRKRAKMAADGTAAAQKRKAARRAFDQTSLEHWGISSSSAPGGSTVDWDREFKAAAATVGDQVEPDDGSGGDFSSVVCSTWWPDVDRWTHAVATNMNTPVAHRPVLFLCGPCGSGKTRTVLERVQPSLGMLVLLDGSFGGPGGTIREQILAARARYRDQRFFFLLDHIPPQEATTDDDWRALAGIYLSSSNTRTPNDTTAITFAAPTVHRRRQRWVPPLVIECRPSDLRGRSKLHEWRRADAVVQTIYVPPFSFGQLRQMALQKVSGASAAQPWLMRLIAESCGDARRLRIALATSDRSSPALSSASSSSSSSLSSSDPEEQTLVQADRSGPLTLTRELYHQAHRVPIETLFGLWRSIQTKPWIGYRLVDLFWMRRVVQQRRRMTGWSLPSP